MEPVRRQRRGMFVLPSLFTAGNIAAGFYAIVQSFQGMITQDWNFFDRAAIALAIAALLDGLDGMIARATGTSSDFGREFDSLADVVTFGVAPAILAYTWGFRMLPVGDHPVLRHKLMEAGLVACFLYLICGAVRLARFNVTSNPIPRNPGKPNRKFFVGMPIPGGAGVIASVVHFENGSPIDNPWVALVWMALVLFTGMLMVSRWRFWSAKEIRLDRSQPVRLLLIFAVIGILLVYWSEETLLFVALAYVVSGMWARLMYAAQSRRAKAAAKA